MQKKSKGKFLTFNFSGRKKSISGVVLDYNEDYTLIRLSYDYALEGYLIFKNERVDHIYGDYEKRAARILKLKKYNVHKEPKIPISSLEVMLDFLSKKYKLISLDTRKGDAMDVVSYLGRSGDRYLFDELTTDAKWRYELRLPEKECRFIGFDSDYLNGLALITKFK